MTTLDRDAAVTSRTLRTLEDVEAHIRAICFKTGPPDKVGVELEWTVHRTGAPQEPLDLHTLRRALGPHAPRTLHDSSPELPLPAAGLLTCEPGGQVELSSAPAPSLTALHAAVSADLSHLTALLTAAGLALGEHGIDPHRTPHRLLRTPRYDAMEHTFDGRGPHGRTMMCSTAGLQPCLDAGPPGQVATRWAAANAVGPPLLAAFATARRHAGRDTGWASARMGAWLGMDPRLTGPVTGPPDDPAAGWVRYALDAPVVCVRGDGTWTAPTGLTLAGWVGGALGRPLTVADLEYHLSTLFPPVRPRGYLEIRYLDAQPGDGWFAPVAVLATLLGRAEVTDQALDLAAPTAGRWVDASRLGVADRELRRTAAALLDLACRNLDLPAQLSAALLDGVRERLHAKDL